MSSKAWQASHAVWFSFLRFYFLFIHPVNKIAHEVIQEMTIQAMKRSIWKPKSSI